MGSISTVEPIQTRPINLIDFVLVIAPVTIGGLIYLLFRSDNLAIFRLIHELGLQETVHNFRLLVRPAHSLIASWAIFSLPTGLWAISFIYCIMIVWRGALHSLDAVLAILAVFLVVQGAELAQAFGLIAGKYDHLDLIANLIGLTLGGTVAYARQ